MYFAGDVAALKAALTSARVANSQNMCGETLLMKSCRLVADSLCNGLPTGKHTALGFCSILSLLLENGANPMVCCDMGKNCLHDLFHMTVPPPREALGILEVAVGLLVSKTGRQGMLSLLNAEDRLGVRH